MGAAEGHDIRHLVPFADYVLYVVTEVREGGVHPSDQVLVPVDAMLVFNNHVAGENIRCHELVGGFWVVLIPNLFVQPADNGLVLFGHRFLLPQPTPHDLLLEWRWPQTP